MGTTGGPYWTAIERRRRWPWCMMAKLTHVFATAFSWRRATKAPSYHGPYVFWEECRWSYISWLSSDSEYCWWYTLWKFDNAMLSNFVFYAVATYKKALGTLFSLGHFLRQVASLNVCFVWSHSKLPLPPHLNNILKYIGAANNTEK